MVFKEWASIAWLLFGSESADTTYINETMGIWITNYRTTFSGEGKKKKETDKPSLSIEERYLKAVIKRILNYNLSALGINSDK